MSTGNKKGNLKYCQTGAQFDGYLVSGRVQEKDKVEKVG